MATDSELIPIHDPFQDASGLALVVDQNHKQALGSCKQNAYLNCIGGNQILDTDTA